MSGEKLQFANKQVSGSNTNYLKQYQQHKNFIEQSPPRNSLELSFPSSQEEDNSKVKRTYQNIFRLLFSQS